VKRPLLTLLLTLLGSVFAHAELASSTPADGEVVDTSPTEVTLTFTEAVEVRFSTFKVYPLTADIDPAAEDAQARLGGLAGQLVSEVLETRGDEDARADTGVSTGERTAETITLTLKPDLAAGVYVVMWRVLAVDAHSTQGFMTFRVEP
jgi:methionine-rich copper-binding protein CopC